MKLKAYQKDFGTRGAVFIKAPSAGAAVSEEQMAKINRFALSDLSADDVYVRKYMIAHNLVDRDRERFSEALLDDFAATFPGKSYLFGHDRGNFLPLGMFFDASVEEMDAEQFTALTGEPAKLPAGVSQVKVVWAWFYILKDAGSDDIIKNIEGGVYRHGSIGFSASGLEPVKGEYDETLFWEYASPGEAREASLVWLGAQQGATTQKAAGDDQDDKSNHKGETGMKTLKVLLGKLLGKTFGDDVTEEQLATAVETVIGDKDAKIKEQADRIKTLESEAEGLKETKALAEEGKKYRKGLVDEYVRMKTALGHCGNTPEEGEALAKIADKMPSDFLAKENDMLFEQMQQKFPSNPQLRSKFSRDKSAEGKQGGGDEENELIPKDAD
jgi:hypothetical protein